MAPSTKLEDKMEGIEKFLAWKYRIGILLKENDLIKAMMIIDDSIKYHLIPQVPYKKTPKKIYDALSRMYEGMNINRKMNLRSQLKGTKMSKG